MAWNDYRKPQVALPLNHHKDDAKWLGEMLLGIHPRFRVDACVKYNAAYEEAYNNEPLPHRKDGKARSNANGRLRAYSAKVADYMHEKEAVFHAGQNQGKTFDISDL